MEEMEAQPDVEILIHIGAPSRAVDDARYRSLATAYLACEVAGAIHCFPQGPRDCTEQGGLSPTGRSSQLQRSGNSEPSLISSDDGISSFQALDASFKSVLDNLHSPKIHTREGPHPVPLQQTPTSGTQESWQTLPSIVQDSDPTNYTGFASLTSPTRVLENYLQHFESPTFSRQDSQTSRPAASQEHVSMPEGCQSPHKNLIPCTPHMIPCTPRIQEAKELASDEREVSVYKDSFGPPQQPGGLAVGFSDDNVVEETTLISSSQPSAHIRADSEPPPKLRKLELITSPRALERSISDIGPHELSKSRSPVTVKFLPGHGFTYESLEIRPAEPDTSDRHIEPQDLLTEGLQHLARDIDLPSHFRPASQTRDLRPFERGHWLIDCSSWDARLKHDAWAFLANYIGTNIAGWGVWCRRDPAFTELRTYCWGSVAAHIYYVLWLSSQRKIVFTGSAWVDADGVEVIKMAPRDCLKDKA
ncbi:hypothetical protein F4777DRAFT_239124 [Nemania sp. FL0916]|nr:hypothetical protein F4777DRAFT_239124 [Nemania sp. FL0916]